MKIEQAKAIPLEAFLNRLGFQPVRRSRGQIWYLSPLRQEKTPSFKVNNLLNLWFDFGQGKGGSIVDFAMAYGKDDSIPAALKLIESTMQGAVPVIEPPQAEYASEQQLGPQILLVRKLQNPDLKRYLSGRGISLQVCSAEICEIHYVTLGKSFVAIGFPSDRGGHELRSRTFKGSLGPKSISTRTGDSKCCSVFEGFFDYLTYVTLWGKPQHQVLVLNSVSLREQAVKQLRESPVSRIELYRDNDAAGEALLVYFKEQLPSIAIIDQATEIYSENKDLNEWRQSTRLAQSSRSF